MKTEQKYIVLLSAGLDSAFNLFSAHKNGTVLLALTFAYGQKAQSQEAAKAESLCEYLKIPHKVIELGWFSEFTGSALLNQNVTVPRGEQVAIDDLVISQQTAKTVWIPNRNGIFLSIAAGFAEHLGAHFVVPGFNLEEAQTFADNTTEFMLSLNDSFKYSTASKVQVTCFSDKLTKTEIVAEAKKMDLPFHMLWPCYFAKEEWCGQCESCQRFKRALRANGIEIGDLR